MQRKLARRLLTAVTLGLIAIAMLINGTTLPSQASSHREAPRTAEEPRIDNTDVYAFRSPDAPNTITLIANYIPFQEPAGGPLFYLFDPSVLYEINIDNDGDAVADIKYRFRFRTQTRNRETFLYNTGPINSLDDPEWNIRQVYNVAEIRNGNEDDPQFIATNLRTPPDNIGPRSTPNYEANLAQPAINTVSTPRGQMKIFAGQRDDGFYVDLGSAFDLFGLRPFNSAHKIPLANAAGVDGLAGFNVKTIAIQVPISALTRDGSTPSSETDPDAIIGVWATAWRRSITVLRKDGTGLEDQGGSFVQVSRLGNPLINELFVGVANKNQFNATKPVDDALFLSRFTDPEPARLIDALYPSIEVPPVPRNDLVAIFLTGIPGLNKRDGDKPAELLRLNVAIAPANTPNRLGLLGGDRAGFPNGRRPGDDVVDIELRAAAGGTPFTPAFNVAPNNQLGDGVNANDKPFLNNFPYLAPPTRGYNSPHGSTAQSGTP
jgi:Domain of unknown function (DUF4331)